MNADKEGVFKASKDLSILSSEPLTVTAGVNDSFKLTLNGVDYDIKLTADTYDSIDDVVNELADKFEKCDGLVVGSPVYYASANATLIAVLDRLFYSSYFDKTMKVGAAVASARRGGLTATFDELNKYFTISGMPVASGQYWNGIHGSNASDAVQDEEGMQQMRTLARNMSFLMKSIALGKERYGLPEKEVHAWTNFIR